MSNRQKIAMAARAVTVAGVAGGALAVGVAAYRPPLAPDLTVSLAAERVIPFERALPRSAAHNDQSGVSG